MLSFQYNKHVLTVQSTYKEIGYIEEFEDTKEVIRIRKSKKDRQHNGQKKKYKGKNNHLESTT